MKKQRLTLFVSALLALGLASCGGESSPEPASTPETPASTATKSDTKTTTSKSTTSKSSTSKSTTPAPVARPYIKVAFNSFEGSEFTEESVNKWEKGFTYKWTFWTSRAEEGITVAIGAQMSSSSHSGRSLYTSSEGADSSDTFESDPANDGTPRIQLANNGVKSEVTHMTYGEAGLTDTELNYFEIGNIAVKEGKNVITITTHAQTGYRLKLGGEIRLLYQAGEADLQGEVQNPTYTISSVSLANEEDHAVLSYHVDYTIYDFDEVKALDWHAGFQGNQNAGGRNWDYFELSPLTFVPGNLEGSMLVKVNLDSLAANRYSGKFGIGVETGSQNAGQARDIHFSGEAAAYQNEITVGTKTYTFKADGGENYWNLPSLEVVDSAEPSYSVSAVNMAKVENRAIVTWTISYNNYTLEQIQAMDWQGAFQANDIVANKGWTWIDYGAGQTNPISVVAGAAEGEAKIEIDVTDYDLNCWMGKLGIGVQTSGDNTGHAFDIRPDGGSNAEFQIGDKYYEFMPKGIQDTWNLPTLFINHAHVYEDVSTLLNADGKPVTIRECSTADCHAKEIVIDFTDGITYGADGNAKSSVQTKMDKGAHTSWKISVDQAIEGAELYFEGSAGVNNGRYFFNQNKEVNPVNPITQAEYPDDTAQSPDLATEDAWRYMFGVGALSEQNPAQHPNLGGTMTEEGAGQKPMLFGNINLAAGENIINLYQMNIGYRMTFEGKVHIRYSGAATITGDAIPEPLVPLDRDPVSVPWATALQSGALDSSNKWNKNTTYTLKVTAPEAAPVVLKLTMKGSDGNGQYTINGTGQGFTITVNGKAADNLLAGKSYTEAFGEDQTVWVQVAFAQFECVAGENTIVIQTNNGGYRLSTDPSADVVLDYRACLPQ